VNKWVIFGAGYVGKAAFLILNKNVDFFIDNDKSKQTDFIEGVPIVSWEKGKMRLCGKTVVIGTVNPTVEREMRSLLSDSDAEQVMSVSGLMHSFDLSHFGKSPEYDYSDVLDAMLQAPPPPNALSEYLYHLECWENSTSKFFLKSMSTLCEKYQIKGSKLADVACGYGFWSLFFVKRQNVVLGIDHDADRLNVFHRISEKYPGVTSITADIRDMKCIPDNTQDIAFCANTIHVVPDWRKIISEMNRITHSNGLMILLMTHPNNLYIKNLYQDLSVMQWDATRKNIVKTAAPDAELIEDIDIYTDESMPFSETPPHSILVFSRR